jgi:hypothetical protein
MRSALTAGLLVGLLIGLWVGGAAHASGVPKRGGTLNFAVVAEPPTTDCHATTNRHSASRGTAIFDAVGLRWPARQDQDRGGPGAVLGSRQGRPHQAAKFVSRCSPSRMPGKRYH